MAARAEIETRCLFIVWAAALLFAACRDTKRSWPALLALAAVACAAIPLADLLAVRLPGGPGALDGVAIGVDTAALGFAGLFAFCARRVRRRAAA
jgi:hypothetical protein